MTLLNSLVFRIQYVMSLFLVILTVLSLFVGSYFYKVILPVKAQPASPQFQWNKVQLNGMGFVTGLLFHPDNGNLLYARTDVGGVYKWNVNTAQWDNISLNNGNSLPNLNVTSIAVDQQDQNVIYMATGDYTGSDVSKANGQIWKSSNQGQSWVALNPVLPNGNKIRINGNSPEFRGGGERLAIDPNNTNLIYYGSNQDGLIRSLDGGTTWEYVTLPTNGNNGTGIAIVTFDRAELLDSKSRNIFIAIPNSGIYKSIDAGQNWNLMTGGGSQYPYRAQVVNSVYYQSYTDRSWSVSGGGLWKLAGSTWTNISPSVNEPVTGFAVSASDPNLIYAEKLFAGSTTSYLYKSTNGGTSWQSLPSQLGQVPSWYGNPSPFENGGGSTWYAQSDAFYSANLIINPDNPNNLLRANGWAVYETTDVSLNPSVWSAKMKNFEELVVNQVLLAPNSRLYMGVWDMGALTLENDNQFPTTRLSFSDGISYVSSIDYSKQNPSIVYAAGSDQNWGNISGGIGKTTDGGSSWTILNTPNDAFNGSIAVGSTNDQNLVWMSRVGSGDWNDWTGSVFYSNNGGQTWQNSTGIPTGSSLLQSLYGKAMVADSVLANTFYSYQCNPLTSWARKIYKSTNGGQSFQEVYSGFDNTIPCTGAPQLHVNPKVESQLWIGCSSDDCGSTTLKYSLNGGSNWQSLNGIDSVKYYAFGAPLPNNTNQTLYAYGRVAGVLGLYASTDALSFPTSPTWTRIDVSASTLPALTTLSADQQVPGKVYVGTSGLGVFVSNIVSNQTNTNLNSLDIANLNTSCTPALANSLTTCTFTLPPNKTLPNDFFLKIGNTINVGPTPTIAQSCTIGASDLVTCMNVTTGNSVGNVPVYGILSGGTSPIQTNTNQIAYIQGEMFGAIDWIFTPNQGSTSPLFKSQDNTTIKINNFRTVFDSAPNNNSRYICKLSYRGLNDRNSSVTSWNNINNASVPYNPGTGENAGCSFNITKAQRANILNKSLKLEIADLLIPIPSCSTNSCPEVRNKYTFYNEYIFRFQGAGTASGGSLGIV